MEKRKFTIRAQLHIKHNRDIIEYMESSRREYTKALRETFYKIKHRNFNKSKHNTYLQLKYGIVKRTANSIISEAQTRFNALKKAKEYEIKQLKNKIAYFENTLIPKLVKKRNRNSYLLNNGRFVSLIDQRNLRLKIVAKKSKLNRLKQKLDNLTYQLNSNLLKFCFGTKLLLKRDLKQFREHRDSQVTFVGARDEKFCNQILQLTYNRKDNQFLIQLRKDFGGYKSVKNNDKFAYGKVYFNHHKKHLISILKLKTSPLSYKIVKKNNRYYLHCIVEIQSDDVAFVTRYNNGTVGLDFNKGFIIVSETNKYGHLIQTHFLPYRFNSGTKTNADVQFIANFVTKLARQLGKDVCIENLDFKNRKFKTEAKHYTNYNKMIHSLAYRQFIEAMESATYRNKVKLTKINPAWTSWLAKQLYCPIMKLNVHVGASYVIARCGQGYSDTLK